MKHSSNEIQRAMNDSVEVLKDAVAQALIQQVTAAGEKGVRRDDLPRLLSVVKAAAEQSYHNSARNFDKVVTRVLELTASEASQPAAPVTKKK